MIWFVLGCLFLFPSVAEAADELAEALDCPRGSLLMTSTTKDGSRTYEACVSAGNTATPFQIYRAKNRKLLVRGEALVQRSSKKRREELRRCESLSYRDADIAPTVKGSPYELLPLAGERTSTCFWFDMNEHLDRGRLIIPHGKVTMWRVFWTGHRGESLHEQKMSAEFQNGSLAGRVEIRIPWYGADEVKKDAPPKYEALLIGNVTGPGIDGEWSRHREWKDGQVVESPHTNWSATIGNNAPLLEQTFCENGDVAKEMRVLEPRSVSLPAPSTDGLAWTKLFEPTKATFSHPGCNKKSSTPLVELSGSLGTGKRETGTRLKCSFGTTRCHPEPVFFVEHMVSRDRQSGNILLDAHVKSIQLNEWAAKARSAVLHGRVQRWDKDGKPTQDGEMHNGNWQKRTVWNEDGSIETWSPSGEYAKRSQGGALLASGQVVVTTSQRSGAGAAILLLGSKVGVWATYDSHGNVLTEVDHDELAAIAKVEKLLKEKKVDEAEKELRQSRNVITDKNQRLLLDAIEGHRLRAEAAIRVKEFERERLCYEFQYLVILEGNIQRNVVQPIDQMLQLLGQLDADALKCGHQTVQQLKKMHAQGVRSARAALIQKQLQGMNYMDVVRCSRGGCGSTTVTSTERADSPPLAGTAYRSSGAPCARCQVMTGWSCGDSIARGGTVRAADDGSFTVVETDEGVTGREPGACMTLDFIRVNGEFAWGGKQDCSTGCTTTIRLVK